MPSRLSSPEVNVLLVLAAYPGVGVATLDLPAIVRGALRRLEQCDLIDYGGWVPVEEGVKRRPHPGWRLTRRGRDEVAAFLADNPEFKTPDIESPTYRQSRSG